MATKRSYPRTQNLLLLVQLLGDSVLAFAGLLLAYWLRFVVFKQVGNTPGDTHLLAYLPLVAIGTLFFITSFAYLKVYDSRILLRPGRTLILFTKGTLFWFCLFLGTSLALKFEPEISRLFVAMACITTLASVIVWRLAFNAWLARSPLRQRIVQRVVIIGWSHDAEKLVNAINIGRNQPYEIAGYISTQDATDENIREDCPRLGSYAEMDAILRNHPIDIAIVADFDLNTSQLLHVANLCELLYVQFKTMPSFFRIFVSSLHLQNISGVPVLGVAELPLERLLYRSVKRLMDITGAIVGLTMSAPIMAWVTFSIQREDPGPVLFRQERIGQNGRPFLMLKLRSMKLGSEKFDHLAQSTARQDPRLLRIGGFIRRWNLDEIPQFWNVLVGDMSLVGPRPERSYHANKLALEIPNYNTRHLIKPGMSGWAQVNGLRGNTSLVDRIRYDLYYIENWSPVLDCQILVLTLLRQKNAY